MNRLRAVTTRAVVTGGVSALLLLGVATPASAEVVNLTVEGSGSNEVPPAGSETVEGTVVIDTDAGTLTYTLSFESEENVANAHIHQAASGANGPVVVPLNAGAIDEAQTTTVNVDAAILQAIVANPGNYYVNLHTATFPNGAARGQLAGGGAAPTATTTTTGAATATTSATASPTTTTKRSSAVGPTSGRKGTAPTAVAAGSGGQFAEAQSGLGGALVLTLGIGLALVGAAGAVLVRRRNS